jgi:hypothetical protein
MGLSQVRRVLTILLPLEPRRNAKSARDYCMSFQEVHNQYRQNKCELCGTVCDNLQARVTGVEQFIQDH